MSGQAYKFLFVCIGISLILTTMGGQSVATAQSRLVGTSVMAAELAGTAVVGAVAVPAGELSISVGKPKIVDQYQGTETDYNQQAHHYCGLMRAGNGNLILLYGLIPDAHPPTDVPLEEYTRDMTGFRISKDKGRTWSPQRTLDSANPKGGTLADGTVLIPSFWLTRISEHEMRMPIQRSTDGGETWEFDRDVRVTFPSDRSLRGVDGGRVLMMGFYGNILSLSKNEVVATIYGRLADSDKFRSILIRSGDQGRSWEFVSVIAGDIQGGHGGYTEPSIVQLRDGRLLCVMRTQYAEPRRMEQCWSSDGGRTWSKPIHAPGIPGAGRAERHITLPDGSKNNFDSANVSPMLRLLDNGILAMTYGRPGVQVAFSRDGTGRTWDKIVEVTAKGSAYSPGVHDSTSGMAGLQDIGNGKIIVVYDAYQYAKTPTDTRANTIFAVDLTIAP